MADCPYARCIQERKHIRRELLRWTKNMVFVVGLERVAEELMGRRRWKQYQDTLYSGTRSTSDSTSAPAGQQHQQQLQLQLQQLAQVQQAKPADSPSQPLKASLVNHQQSGQAAARANCAPSSPRRADETGGPSENGRVHAEGARENGGGATGTSENGAGEIPEDASTTTTTTTRQTELELTTATAEGQEEEEDESPATRIKRERLDERIRIAADEDEGRTNEDKLNDTEGTKEVKEETGLEQRVAPVTQGLLRVKKEEELQETPGPGGGVSLLCPARPTSTPLNLNNNNSSNNNNNSSSNNNNGLERSASTPPKKELVFCAPAYALGGRRPSPPPEDWKPLDKCYFCLDGKLPHDEQPPLSPQSDSSNSSRSAESPMSVQVDPMAASVVAAALSGTYPTLLPQWCLQPREPPHVIAAAAAAAAAAAQHQENAGADQPLDLSAKPKTQDNNISMLEQQKIPLRMSAAIDPKTMFNYRAKPRVTGGVTASGVPVVGGGASGRRTYTEDELQAALRDIQTGKLGTRRAAVLYGIPRSTLRNKVYKLAMERERDASLAANAANNTTSSTTTPTNNNNSHNTSTTATPHSNNSKNGEAAVVAGAGPQQGPNAVAAVAAACLAAAVAAASSSATTAAATPSTMTSSTTTTTTTATNSIATARLNANAATTPLPQVDEVDDKELSGAEEEKEVERALLKPLLSIEDLVRFSSLEGSGGESLRALLQRGQEAGGPNAAVAAAAAAAAADWSSAFEHTNIGPYIQKMLAAAAPFKDMENQYYRIPEVMRRLMCEDKRFSKDANVNGDQVQHLHHASLQHRLTQSSQRAPMTNDDFNPTLEDEASDSGQGRPPILKIPSYKPASGASAVTGTTTPIPGGKNGPEAPAGPSPAAFAQSFAAAAAANSPGLLERASPAFSGTSSPTNSLVGKGMAVNFRDVIAKSISVKFQEGQPPSGMPGQGGPGGQSILAEPNPYKRGRYTPPQPTSASAQAQSQGQQAQSKSSAQSQDSKNQNKGGAGGKGTRPKRGKYRNYDRDSLVEAVRAVQRGEMSVHRAGSYYGVPHSTLEYKVKERHLMRPRKRDQKQPDDKAKEAPAAGAAPLRTGTTASTPDKKPPLLKPQKPFTPATGAGAAAGMPGPNGLKMPPFMDGMTHLPFAHPFNFWGPTPFMPTPFIPGGPNVPGMLPEQYFATQRMRGLQEQQRNAIVQQQQQRDGTPAGEQPGTSNPRATSLIKSSREMAESLYDGTAAANGSFLDNLIRSSLESGIPRDRGATANAGQTQPENLGSSKVLIDQLCRNSRRTPLPRPMQQDSSEDEAPSNYSRTATGQRSLPDRPERVPTVDLSPSPSERARATDEGSDRGLASPPTPLSLSRLSGSGREDETTRDSRSSREREVQNGGGTEKADDRPESNNKKLNHYPDIHNLYAVSTDKKSACDSKLIVDHSSQKTQQQPHKDFTAVGGAAVAASVAAGGLVVQLQRGYNNGNNSPTNGRPVTPTNQSSQQQQPSSQQQSTERSPSPEQQLPQQQLPTTMEETVEQ